LTLPTSRLFNVNGKPSMSSSDTEKPDSLGGNAATEQYTDYGLDPSLIGTSNPIDGQETETATPWNKKRSREVPMLRSLSMKLMRILEASLLGKILRSEFPMTLMHY
jgi:hypothetical protein